MAIRHYPAIVEGDAKTGYSVFFPDLPGCTSGGETLQRAALNAEEALAGHVDLILQAGDALPEPSVLDALPRPVEPDVVEAARLLVRVRLRETLPA
jgi:predicted RNase H-like HicB family nuclease